VDWGTDKGIVKKMLAATTLAALLVPAGFAQINVAIVPGQSVAIDSGLGHTYADTVRISV
jgi:hypothetical protein